MAIWVFLFRSMTTAIGAINGTYWPVWNVINECDAFNTFTANKFLL